MSLPTHVLMSLRDRREASGIKARDAAARIGISTGTYYKYERGDARPFLDHGLALAKMLGCLLEDLARPLTIDERVEFYRQAQLAKSVSKTEPAPTPASASAQPATPLIDDGGDAPAQDPVDIPGTPEYEAKMKELLSDWDNDAD